MKYNDSIQRFRYLRAMANEGMLVCPCCGNECLYDAWEAAGFRSRFRSYPNEEGVECICNRINRQTFWDSLPPDSEETRDFPFPSI